MKRFIVGFYLDFFIIDWLEFIFKINLFAQCLLVAPNDSSTRNIWCDVFTNLIIIGSYYICLSATHNDVVAETEMMNVIGQCKYNQ